MSKGKINPNLNLSDKEIKKEKLCFWLVIASFGWDIYSNEDLILTNKLFAR